MCWTSSVWHHMFGESGEAMEEVVSERGGVMAPQDGSALHALLTVGHLVLMATFGEKDCPIKRTLDQCKL